MARAWFGIATTTGVALGAGNDMTEILSQEHVDWLEGRGIDSEIASRYGLYTNRQSARGHELVFPFHWNGEVVNRKYRGADKSFRQDKGAIPAFFNADVVRD